jgi:hypothetical protein
MKNDASEVKQPAKKGSLGSFSATLVESFSSRALGCAAQPGASIMAS